METHKIRAPFIRRIGERFAHPVHGELVVAAATATCTRCVFIGEKCSNPDSSRGTIAGSCSSTIRGHNVVFAKSNDYAVFKLTGEWP